MKINYAMFGTGLTGGVRVILEIANRLVDRGHEVTVTTFGEKPLWFKSKAEIIQVKVPQNERVINYALRRMKIIQASPFSYNRIRSLCDAIPDCDVNVATYCFTAFAVFESGKGNSFYHMQHYEPLFFSEPCLKRFVEETYYLPLTKMVNSIWLQNLIRDRYGYDLPVVNPAIDHEVFYPRKVIRADNNFRVLCFAKQTRWKGFPEALEAVKQIRKVKPNVKLITFGQERPTYQTDVPYEFLKNPSDSELAELYSSADIVLCPSWYESFPLYPLEAMACGAPVVTTSYGTEDYAFNRENCLVVQPKKSGALAKAVLELLNNENLREQFRKEGPRIAANFTWEKTTNAVEKLMLPNQ